MYIPLKPDFGKLAEVCSWIHHRYEKEPASIRNMVMHLGACEYNGKAVKVLAKYHEFAQRHLNAKRYASNLDEILTMQEPGFTWEIANNEHRDMLNAIRRDPSKYNELRKHILSDDSFKDYEHMLNITCIKITPEALAQEIYSVMDFRLKTKKGLPGQIVKEGFRALMALDTKKDIDLGKYAQGILYRRLKLSQNLKTELEQIRYGTFNKMIKPLIHVKYLKSNQLAYP